MSDTYVPSSYSGRSVTSDSGALDIGQRVRIVTSINPYMADRPDILTTMVQQPMTIDELVSNAGQMYGQMAGDNFAQRLGRMSPGTQRAIWGTLGKNKQMAMAQMDYEPPEDEGRSWMDMADRYLGPIDEIAAKGLGGIGQATRPLWKPALDTLNWVGDQPAHLYRTIRLMDDDAQWLALAGAAVGIAGIVLAVPTGGLSTLATMGVLAGGGLAGGTVAAIGSNPHDWWRAFGESWEGERTFDRAARRKADDLLGDPRLIGLAQDMASLDDFSISDLATELAGQRGNAVETNTMVHALTELSTRFGPAGSPEQQAAYQAMLKTASDPTFQQAVTALQQGKISIGRDIADGIGLAPDSGLHRLVSGLSDAAWLVAVDPTLMLGSLPKFLKARRAGVRLAEGSTAAEAFIHVVQNNPQVRAYQDVFLEAFNTGNLNDILAKTREMAPAVPELLAYRNARGLTRLTHDDLMQYYVGAANTDPLSRGIGTVRGAKGTVLAEWNKPTRIARTLKAEMRAFTGGLTDPKLERRISELINEARASGDMTAVDRILPGFSDLAIDTETGVMFSDWYQINQSHLGAYEAGRAIGQIPGMAKVGEVLTAITTQIPTSKAIELTGPNAAKNVRALAEMGRYMGMPSWARRAWADSILFADDIGSRSRMVHGWLDNAMTISGAKATPQGRQMVEDYLENSRMTYGHDDTHVVDGVTRRQGIFLSEQADAIVMPDIQQLHRAAATGHMATFLGIVDAPVIETFQNKIWKPAVLLRIGFIPRAAGEEYLNFMFRGGFGGMVQNYAARSTGHREAYLHAVDKAKTGAKLTADEARMLSVGWTSSLPAHIRPVVRIFADRNWDEPGIVWIDRYAEWWHHALREGLGQEKTIQRGLSAIAGQEYQVGNAVDASRVARSWNTPRLNLADKANSILLGNPHSWRRMITGGVNDDLAESMRKMASEWSGHMASDLFTSGHAGPWDIGQQQQGGQVRQMRDTKGRLRELPSVTVKGQPKIYDKTAWEYKMGIQARAQTLIHDPLAAEIARQHVARIRGGVDIADEQIDRLYDLADEVQSDVGREIMFEYLGAPEEKAVRAMLREVRGIDPEAGELLSLVKGEGMITPTDLIELIARSGSPEMIALADELRSVAKIDDLLSGMSVDARRFGGQTLRGEDGIKQSWRAHRASPDEVQSPFVNSWADVDEQAREAAYTSILDSYNQAAASRSERLSGAGLALEGQTVLWRLPYKATGRTGEELIAMGVPADVVARNADIIDELSLPQWADEMPLTSDRQLADALWAASEPGGKPDGVMFGESVLKGGVYDDGALVPAVIREGRDDRTVLWAGRREIYNSHRVNAAHVKTAEDRARELADQVVSQMRQGLTRSNAQAIRAKGYDVADEGGVMSRETGIFRESDQGVRVPVTENEVLRPGYKYYDRRGKPVEYNDPRRTIVGSPDFDEAGEVMWALVGPMLEDLDDARRGTRRFLPKKQVQLQEGALAPIDADEVPIFRSRSEHVLEVGAGLPEYVSGPRIEAQVKSKWDEFVQFGFGRVIGPAIDAIVRKPQAAHMFHERYMYAKRAAQWQVDSELMGSVGAIARRAGKGMTDVADINHVADAVKRVMVIEGDKGAAKWTTAQTMAWLRGGNDDEFITMLDRVIKREGVNTYSASARQAVADAHLLKTIDPTDLRHTLPTDMGYEEFLSYIRSQVPPRGLESATQLRSRQVQQAIFDHPVLSRISDDDWETLLAAERNLQAVSTQAGAYAAQAAIHDMIPFIDSHEFKSQFAEFGKQFMPFWYAEENFLKRWARTLADEGLPVIRKAQLGYMGIKHAGVVRSDAQGNDYFVYPGSSLLIEALEKIPGFGSVLPIGALMQTQTKSLLPGMNENFGKPSFSPLVALPLGLLTAAAPALEPLQQAVVGDYAASQGALKQLFPTQVHRFWEAFVQTSESNQTYASAKLAAIAQLEAEGKGPPDGATAGDLDKFYRMVDEHAKVIIQANAIMGFFSPGTPSNIATGETENFMGLGVKDPKNLLSDTYYELIKNLGVEEGTIEYQRLYPGHGLTEIINPVALTQGATTSRSGAYLPATQIAGKWIEDNGSYIDEFPFGAPWLLPQDPDAGDTRSQYAYDQQTIHHMRDKNAPEDFYRSIKFKEASGTYFQNQTKYLDAIATAELAENDALKQTIEQNWQIWSTTWKAAHPVFAEELQSGEGRERRAKVLLDLRTITNDPGAPESPQLDLVRTVVKSYDSYKLQLMVLQDDRSAAGRAKAEQLKLRWGEWMSGYGQANPTIGSFLSSIIRPESSLD